MAALSLATDLGMGQPQEQALRYCLVSLELGRRVGCDGGTLSDIYYLALVEHLGCTSTAPEIAAWNGGDELAFRRLGITLPHASNSEVLRHFARHVGEGRSRLQRTKLFATNMATGQRRFKEMVAIQCEGAAHLADRLEMAEGVKKGLLHFYERWDGAGAPSGLTGEAVSLPQRIVSVAQDAVIHSRLSGTPSALELIARRRGAAYDPEVCDALVSDSSLLLDEDDSDDLWARVLEAEPEPRRILQEAELDGVARGFAEFTDLKAPFLMGHSQAVAELAAAGAGVVGLGPEETSAVRRAGLLHDVGRLGVPNGIWEKPGALTSPERERVRLHPYYTERILARTAVFAPVAVNAACHHERVDGSGYHRGVGASQLSVEARLLAAADAYDALTHERPYRRPLDSSRARAELRTGVENGGLDQRATNAVLEAAGARPVRVREAWPAGLSDREVEVLRFLARGKTNRQIASELVISQKTVGRHVENIYTKTGLSTRAGAALFASEHELLG